MRFKTSPPKGQRLPKPTSPGKSIPAKTGNFAAAITFNASPIFSSVVKDLMFAVGLRL
jgi:hypothetical protein